MVSEKWQEFTTDICITLDAKLALWTIIENNQCISFLARANQISSQTKRSIQFANNHLSPTMAWWQPGFFKIGAQNWQIWNLRASYFQRETTVNIQIANISMYLFNEIKRNVHIQRHGNYIKGNNIQIKYSKLTLWVSEFPHKFFWGVIKGDCLGSGCPKNALLVKKIYTIKLGQGDIWIWSCRHTEAGYPVGLSLTHWCIYTKT